MSASLDGKRVVILGGTSGIGLATAEAVADEVAHAKIVERPVTVDEIKGLLDAAYE